MSCRWVRAIPARVSLLADDGPWVELLKAGRRDDFRWLARSRGISDALVDELWERLRLGLAHPPEPAD